MPIPIVQRAGPPGVLKDLHVLARGGCISIGVPHSY